MASSTCVKCGGNSFENKEVEPKGSNYKLTFIQCSNCGGVIGAMDYLNLGSMLQEIKRHLNIP